MARYYKKRRFYRRRGRWSANIKTITGSNINASVGSFVGKSELCTNPVQSDLSVSQQYTVKNVEVSFEMEFPTENENYTTIGQFIEGLTAYIMFVPQGMDVTETYPNTHPEYIMAYKFYGSPNYEVQTSQAGGGVINPGRNAVKIKTRMARRLQTGDKIMLLIVGTNNGPIETNIHFNGIVRWWTKAN